MNVPPANATRAEVRAFRDAAAREHNEDVERHLKMLREIDAAKRAQKRRVGKVECAACGKLCNPSPLKDPVRIRFSAKFKGREFGTGQTLCHRHSVEFLHERRP